MPKAVSLPLVLSTIKRLTNYCVVLTNFAESWTHALDTVLLGPLKIDGTKIPTMSAETAQEYEDRFPGQFKKEDFIYPVNHNGAFPIIGITLVNPSGDGIRFPSLDSYTLLEATPLYVGEAIAKNLTYPKFMLRKHYENVTVGGLVETVGFGGKIPPGEGLGDSSEGLLNVSKPEKRFDLRTMLGSTSYCPGGVFSGLPIIDNLDFTGRF